MGQDDLVLERFEVRIPRPYKAFIESVRIGQRFSSDRAVIEHLIEWYAVEVERHFTDEPALELIPPERSRVAMYRYQLGVTDHMRLLAELDAAMKLDSKIHPELRHWQASVKMFAAHMQDKFSSLDPEAALAMAAALVVS